MNITPFYIDPAQLRGLRNMKPDTYPAEPIKPEDLVSKALVVPVPKLLWYGDYLVEGENGDISWMEHHFQASPGDLLWIREKHRYHVVGDGMVVEFADGEKKRTPVTLDRIRFTDGRWLAPLGLHKASARFVLKVREIGVRWVDEATKKDIVWIIGVERIGNVDLFLGEVK